MGYFSCRLDSLLYNIPGRIFEVLHSTYWPQDLHMERSVVFRFTALAFLNATRFSAVDIA